MSRAWISLSLSLFYLKINTYKVFSLWFVLSFFCLLHYGSHLQTHDERKEALWYETHH